MSRYDHKIETSLEGIEHLSKEKKEKKERKMNVKEKNQEIKDYPIFNRRGKQRIKTKNYNCKLRIY